MKKALEFIKIAFRNLGRHKVKTIITCTAITIGIASYIFLDAMMVGMNIGAKRNIVNHQSGSAKIYTKAYLAEKEYMPLYEGFTNYEPILKKLDEAGYNGAPSARFGGTLIHKGVELPFNFAAVEPESFNKVFDLEKFIVQPGKLESDAFSVVLGINGANKLKVKIGDVVKLYTVIKTKDAGGNLRNEYQVILLTVSGLLNTPNMVINGNFGVLPMAMLQDERGLRLEGNITEIAVRKKNPRVNRLPGKSESPETISTVLKDVLPEELTVISWREDNKDLIMVMETKADFSSIIIAILVIIVIIGVSNTMLMAVMERTKEIGMMSALGMTRDEILILYMLEAGMIGLIGSVFGVILGTLCNWPLVVYGLDFTKMMESGGYDESFSLIALVYSVISIKPMILSIVCMTLTSSITAFFPAYRAVRKSIVDALRFE